jgi:hypothetical protein
MTGKNPLYVSRQHGHSVETMWRTYSAWMDGAIESDIALIKDAMERDSATAGAMPRAEAAKSPVACEENSRFTFRSAKLPRFLGLVGICQSICQYVRGAVSQPQERERKTSGGEGGIRTHVPELPDHPISSRRRYDHFGTSPLT